MTNFARSLSPAGVGRVSLSKAAVVLACTLVIICLGLLVVVATAGAVVTELGGTTVGLQPRNQTTLLDGRLELNVVDEGEYFAGPQTFANAAGNPVVHGAGTYAIFWDPTNNYHGDWVELISGFLQEEGSSSGAFASVFAVDQQYTDKTNKPAAYNFPFHGTMHDYHPYPAAACTDPHPLLEWKPHNTGPITCLTDTEVRQELNRVIAANGLPTGMGYVYYMLTPPGVTVCMDAGGPTGHCSDFSASGEEEKEHKFETASYRNSFCSYHGDINPDGAPTGDGKTVLYGMIPWSAGGLGDGQLNPLDQTYATYCQDGGFNPASKPAIELWEGQNDQEPNQASCPTTDGFCDYGLADLIVGQVAAEQQNIVTNPLLNAWHDAAGNEVTDECRNFFAPASGSFPPKPGSGAGTLFDQTLVSRNYFLNTAFNKAATLLNYPGIDCLPGIRLEPQFTAPSTINSGEVVGFDGMESAITLNAATAFSATGSPQPNYATYTWGFGDGTAPVSGYAPGSPTCEAPWLTPCAASVFHSYQYGGRYEVTLTVKDVAGNVATASHAINVVGPPPPSPSGSGGSTGGGSTSGGSSSSSSTPAGGTHPPAPPVATGAVVTRSLRSAVRKGVVVSYSVSQQVAGRFEVLLGASTGKRLGIGGPAAVGLPAGSAPQIVIGKALLVTTSAGRNTVRIYFSKRTATRLRRARRVSLMLRMLARGPGSAPTVVLSAFTLSG